MGLRAAPVTRRHGISKVAKVAGRACHFLCFKMIKAREKQIKKSKSKCRAMCRFRVFDLAESC